MESCSVMEVQVAPQVAVVWSLEIIPNPRERSTRKLTLPF